MKHALAVHFKQNIQCSVHFVFLCAVLFSRLLVRSWMESTFLTLMKVTRDHHVPRATGTGQEQVWWRREMRRWTLRLAPVWRPASSICIVQEKWRSGGFLKVCRSSRFALFTYLFQMLGWFKGEATIRAPFVCHWYYIDRYFCTVELQYKLFHTQVKKISFTAMLSNKSLEP